MDQTGPLNTDLVHSIKKFQKNVYSNPIYKILLYFYHQIEICQNRNILSRNTEILLYSTKKSKIFFLN